MISHYNGFPYIRDFHLKAISIYKGIHFTIISTYKRFPYIRDLPLHMISSYIYEGFPLYKGVPCISDFLV